MPCNVCVEAGEGYYAILFSREGKKPHKIVASTNDETYRSFVLGCTRAFKLVKDTTFVFRSDNHYIRKLLKRDYEDLDECERELVDIFKNKNLTLIIRNELQMYRDILEKEISKKKSKRAVSKTKKPTAPESYEEEPKSVEPDATVEEDTSSVFAGAKSVDDF